MAKVVEKKSAKRRVKKRSKGIKEKPEVAYDEEENETMTSEEEEEEEKDEEDERKHQKLLEAISSLGGERGTRVMVQGPTPWSGSRGLLQVSWSRVPLQGHGPGSGSRVLVQDLIRLVLTKPKSHIDVNCGFV